MADTSRDFPTDQTNGRTILSDIDNSWVRVPYQVTIGDTFVSTSEALRWAVDFDQQENKVKYANVSMYGEASSVEEFVGLPADGMMGMPYFRDTRVGANDAINCLWQFNRDDDIVHEMNYSTPDKTGIGMGRVYAATIEQNQSIAWFTFGVARFTKLTEFYANAFNANMIKLNSTGAAQDSGIGALFEAAGNVAALAIAIPTIPVRWLYNWMTSTLNIPVNRFYDLRTTMHLYYKYVDSILMTWLVNTGIYNGDWTSHPETLPMSIRETGASIWDVLKRKATMLAEKKGSKVADTMNFEAEVEQMTKMKPEEYDKDDSPEVAKWSGNGGAGWENMLWSSALGATQFVGFRIEKSTDSSESFSNSTGPSAFAEKINSMIQQKKAAAFDMGGGANTGVSIVDSAIQGVQGLLTGISGAFNMDGLASAILSGAFIDIPEQYKGSDFNKSHSLSFQLRAPYGDIVSIYQSIMIPLAMIMAGALPHAAGPNSYMQPFLCRVYSKGLFSVPLGIIDSLSIKRGSSEFGWTYQNLPTCIDVTVGIKDLSPLMYIGLRSGMFQNMVFTNNTMDEYLMTLAGVGAWERISRMHLIRKNMQIMFHRLRNTTFNAMAWTSWLSDTAVVRFIGNFLPGTRIPTRQGH